MFTRCPKCKTAHPLSAQILAHAQGSVQCGQCGNTFSALQFLFEGLPSGKPIDAGTDPDVNPPVIGKRTQKTKTTKKTRNTEIEHKTEEQETAGADLNSDRMHWHLMAAVLVLVTIANIGWTFREPLLENSTISGWFQVKQEGLLTDPGQFKLISRDMHSHPTRSGILVLSLTFVNLASRPQVFPTLEITLLDGSNQPIARRRFEPADYLRPGASTESGLATDVFLPVLLELADPGEQAIGFEIQFL